MTREGVFVLLHARANVSTDMSTDVSNQAAKMHALKFKADA
jgi:hypothetical protein